MLTLEVSWGKKEGRERGREERKRGKGEEERRQADTVPDTVVCKQLHQLSINNIYQLTTLPQKLL